MPNELKSLSEIFQKRVFRIPDYQRGYAWKQEQLVDFWEDLQNLSEDRYHYTGLLSLKKIGKHDQSIPKEEKWLLDGPGFDFYHIVDGQQRLTTFSILIFEIVNHIKRLPANQGKCFEEIVFDEFLLSNIIDSYIYKKRVSAISQRVYLFGYQDDKLSAQYLTHLIFEEPHGSTTEETYYTRNLKQAKEFFRKNIDELYRKEGIKGIESLFKKLTLQLKFNLHEIEDEYDVFVAFETMNNRGKRLTHLELLKNRLIYLSTLYRNEEADEMSKEALRAKINSAWREIYFQLGRNAGNLLPDDDLLRAHWILYFQYTRKRGDDYINYLLMKKFTSKNIFINNAIRVEEDAGELTDRNSLEEDLDDEANEEIIESSLKPLEIETYVNSIKDFSKHWYISYFPNEDPDLNDEEKTWIKKLNRIGIADFRPLVAASLSKNARAEERVNLFKAIERFIFLFYRVGRWRGNFKNSSYFIKARALFYGETTLQAIADSLRQDVDMEMETIIASFVNETNRRFNNGDGFYSWFDLRYFFYEYEDSLIPFERSRKIEWDVFSRREKSKVSIEHIFPQMPTNQYWQSRFSIFTPAEQHRLTGSIGNLLPLSLSINISLQNDAFPDKKNPPHLGRSGYSKGSYSELEVATNDDWNAVMIKRRGKKLLEWMATRWNIPFGEDHITELLHLDFVDDQQDSNGDSNDVHQN